MNKVYRTRKKEKHSLQSPLQQWLKKDGWALAGIIILLGLGGWFGFISNDKFVTNNIEVNDLQFLNKEEVISMTHETIQKPVLGFWPRNNYFTVSTDSVADAITERFASDLSLESLQVNKKWPDTLQIQIQERVPAVAWVTRSVDGQEHFYLVDYTGTVSQVLPNFDAVDKRLPRVRDDNRAELGLDWHIMSAEYISFLMEVNDRFTAETGLGVDSYIFPETRCQERQFVAEKIFQQEILDSASEEFKNRKREIQEQFQAGVLSIDQSLEQLEQIKIEEVEKLGEVQNNAGLEKLEWQTVYMEAECDYVNVATDLHVAVPVDGKSIEVKLDRAQDVTAQFENIVTVIENEIDSINNVQYIDVRIPDRVTYK